MSAGRTVFSSYEIDGQKFNAPLELSTLEVYATFDNDSVQANISTTELTFVLDAATKLIQKIEEGKTGGEGIFQGVPFKIKLKNEINNIIAFDGLIDLANGVEIDETKNKVKTKIRLKSQLFTLEEQLTALTYDFLKEKGIITNSDYSEVEYVVQKKINVVETIILALTLYLMIKQLKESIEATIKNIADLAALLAGGGLTGILGTVILKLAQLIFDSAMGIFLVMAITDLAETLFTQLIPIKRKAKCIKLKTALEKVAGYLGYALQTDLTELDELYYLPSNYNYDEVDNKGVLSQWKGVQHGIPNSCDYGYNCADMFELAKKRVNGKFAIINNVIWFYTKNDDIWVRNSTYKMPKTLQAKQKIKYNTDELIANKLFSFDVDFSDEKTIENFQGTNFEVITKEIISSNKKEVYIKGLKEVRFGISLGNRKEKLSGFENFLSEVAGEFDKIINYFGGDSDYAGKIKNTIGRVVIGNNNYQKPKLLKLDGAMKLQNRNLQSAMYVYDTYYASDSFVENNFAGQKSINPDIKIPFSLENFIELINNSYFYTEKEKEAKITDLKYRFMSGYATASNWVREPYTHNLQEFKIEPKNE